MSTVLVTGGSGFIGVHTILQLLAAGHRVRTTVRNLNRESDVRTMLQEGGANPSDQLAFIEADLTKDAGWPEAVAGCDYVLHVASPFPPTVPRHEDDLIIPARDGTLRVLRASTEAAVKRVVLTSSFAAIGYGKPAHAALYDERDWTNPDTPGATAYVKSKTLAERAAWDFVERNSRAPELAVVNPVAVFGPALGPDLSSSVSLIQRMLNGGMPGVPHLYFGVVDVRDVADLHVRAMTSPVAKGERFLATGSEFLPLIEIARILRRNLGAAANKVPTRELPDWVLRGAALFVPAARQITPELGKKKNGTSAKARDVLGWKVRSNEEALVATAESLIRLGLAG